MPLKNFLDSRYPQPIDAGNDNRVARNFFRNVSEFSFGNLAERKRQHQHLNFRQNFRRVKDGANIVLLPKLNAALFPAARHINFGRINARLPGGGCQNNFGDKFIANNKSNRIAEHFSNHVQNKFMQNFGNRVVVAVALANIIAVAAHVFYNIRNANA